MKHTEQMFYAQQHQALFILFLLFQVLCEGEHPYTLNEV